jgi:hypothetical protein
MSEEKLLPAAGGLAIFLILQGAARCVCDAPTSLIRNDSMSVDGSISAHGKWLAEIWQWNERVVHLKLASHMYEDALASHATYEHLAMQ